MTVLLAFLNFGPYHSARLTAAQRNGSGSGTAVIGLSMASHQSEYGWHHRSGEPVLTASPHLPLEEVPAGHWRSLLKPILDQVRPDVCAIAGYSHPSMVTLIALCGEREIPWILMSDSQEIDEKRNPLLERIKSRLVRLASTGFAAGRSHVAYLETLGLLRDDCTLGYDVVDNDYFAEESAKWKLRGTEGPRPYFLSSNRFIPKKNLFRLLEAYARVCQLPTANCESAWPLCLLGDGELKGDLLAHAAALKLTAIERAPWEVEKAGNTEIGKAEIKNGENGLFPNEFPPSAHSTPPTAFGVSPTLFLPGFRQIDELPRFYAGAGVLVHASTNDQWGLVVNEAMASGLPVIVSDRSGCARELVEEGVNGFTFDPHDIETLTELMQRVSTMPNEELSSLGQASRRIISDWGPDRFARGLQEAAERAIAIGPKRGSWMDRLILKLLIRR